ncbi:MAG: mobilization protein [Maritimibacter sp.]|nr:mobilization protein [Maritimibacter sp.]
MSKRDQQISQLEERLRALRAAAASQVRKDDTRRKIILGHALIKHLETLPPEKRKALLAGLHAYVTRPSDRRFLGLAD